MALRGYTFCDGVPAPAHLKGIPVTRCHTRFVALGLIFCLAFVAGCKKKAPVVPDPVEVTETFTGTISPLGSAFHQFNVTYSYATTGAAVTVTSLTSVANGTPQSIKI